MFRLVLTLLTAFAFAVPAAAADTTYRDARQPSFTLLVPDGWSAERNDQGVLLRRDESYFQLRVSPGGASPGSMLVQIRPQFERQYKGFRELESGRTTFGGRDGAYAVYGGVPPSGIDAVTKVIAMTNGQLVYLAFAGMPAEKVQRYKADLDRIERSFTPDPVR